MESNEQMNLMTESYNQRFSLQRHASDSSVTRKDYAMTSTGGFSSLSLSPQMSYMSPKMLENTHDPRLNFRDDATSRLMSQPIYTPTSHSPEPRPSDEEEMVCIRLLAHLKKSGDYEYQTSESVLDLIQKSNAALRRILTSRKARTDYGCIMLLSNIMTQVVNLCEKTCKYHLEERQSASTDFLGAFGEDFLTAFGEPSPYTDQRYFNIGEQSDQSAARRQATIQSSVEMSRDISACIADLLKTEPYDGLQAVGKHEGLHLDLDKRLKTILSRMQQ